MGPWTCVGKKEKGKIILIEGTDGSGKNTQAKKLVERLNQKGHSSEKMSFPRYDNPEGRIIGECYLGKGGKSWFGDADSVNPIVASLYYAADRFAAKEKMEEILNSGKNLILDRYVESNMAHQGGKETDPSERNKIINYIEKLEYGLHRLPKPDLTFFLYMPFEQSEKLRKIRGDVPDGHESNINHLKRAEEAYIELAEERGWRKINCTYEGNLKTPEEIHEVVYAHALSILKQ